MQNIDVRFNATSNFSNVRGDLAALQAQAAALNATFEKGAYAKRPMITDAAGWKQATAAVNSASRAYRDAASSSGKMTTQQIRAIPETERYTKALQKQKLTMQDMVKHRGLMREVYRDQLRYQRMTAQYWGTDSMGRAVTDIAIPRSVPKDLDTMGTRMRYFGSMARSAGTQVVNLGKNIQWSGRQLTVGFTYPLALFGAAAGVMAYKVEDAFAKINKVYDVSEESLVSMAAREKELGELRVSSMRMAEEVAAKYGKTIASTLEIEQALAATGLKGNDLLTSTSEVQRISALGDLDPTMTTEMVVALKNAFRETIPNGEELTGVLNFMNAASNATSLSLADIAEATPRAASGLAQLGVDAKQMTILLVSMREAGVNAAEGANALKSATTRILNPAIVKKAQDYYKGLGVNIDISDMVKKSDGNLYEFTMSLGKAVREQKELTDGQKAAGIAALFGTYQFNRLNAVLANLGVEGTQAAKAIELLGKSNNELAEQAKQSEEAMMNNPAGKFRQEWAKFQIELSKMGNPFLEAATKILGLFTSLGKAFNDMDDWKKKLVMMTVAILALVGPVIMLTGLFFNLFGQAMRGVGNLSAVMGRLAGGIGLVTKEEKAAALSTEAQNNAMKKQVMTTATLAEEIAILTAAYQEATRAATQLAAAQGVASKPMVPLGPQTKTIAGTGYQMSSQEQKYFSATSNQNAQGRFISDQLRLEQARNKMAYDYMRANGQVARDAAKTEQRTAATARLQEKVRGSVSGTSVAMGAMGIAMAGMMLTGDGIIHDLSKMLLIGTLIVPPLIAVAKWTGMAAKAAWAEAAGRTAALRATMGQAGATGVAAAGMRGVAAGAMAIMGPIGWTATAITGIAAGLYIWHKRQKEIYAEQVKNQEALDSSADRWAESTGKVAEEYARIALASQQIIGDTKNTKFIDIVSQYESGGAQEDTGDAFKDLNDDERRVEAMRLFLDYQKMGDSAKQAAQRVGALYFAVTESYEDADDAAQMLLNTVGKLNNVDWGAQVAEQAAFAADAFGDNEDVFEDRLVNMAQFFREGWANGTAEQARGMLDTVIEESRSRFVEVFDEFSDSEAFKKFGITSADQLAAVWRDKGDELMNSLNVDDGMNLAFISDAFKMPMEDAEEFEKKMIEVLAGKEGFGLGKDIKTIDDLLRQAVVWTKMLTFEQAISSIKTLRQNLRAYKAELAASGGGNMFTDIITDSKEAGYLELANQILVNNGLEEAGSLAEAYKRMMKLAAGETGEAADEAGNLKNKLSALPNRLDIDINIKSFGGIMQTAMGEIQDNMADSAMDKFNAGWDSRMDSAQAGWDAKMDAQSNAQERQMEAFDNRWERRKEALDNAYQRRIDAINREIEAEQKADEARQRAFEKEKARLQQLAELENANIDFNTALNEGRLDDAAKIQNNMGATAGANQMDAEQRAAEAATQAKIERLEKKNERLEKQRDKEMKQLEKMEDRQRKALERMQERASNALQARSEAAMDAMDREREYDEATLQQRLDLFVAYTARNKKDLEAWMKELGFSYDDFGVNVEKKGEAWATSIRESLLEHMRRAGMEILSENMWENVGAEMAKRMLKGIGFANMAEFTKFVNTGEMPKPEGDKKGTGGIGIETHHGGGIVGQGGSGRGSIPNTYKGLHRTERMIRAQAGERIIDKKNSERFADTLDAISNGRDTGIGGLPEGGSGIGSGSISGFQSPNALIAGIVAKMWEVGMGKSLANIASKVKKAPTAGAFFPGQGIDFGFKPGPGGRHRPVAGAVTNGLHGGTTAGNPPAVDMAGPTGRPVYAVSSGTITQSRDIAGPLASDTYRGDGPYGSFGRMIQMKTDSGAYVLYGHLSRRSVAAGSRVTGGSVIGATGNTGNSSGPHLHFGATNGPYAWLRQGGTIRYDNTPVIAHRGETMLSASLTNQFKDNVAGGSGTQYNVTIDLRGAYIKEDVDIEKAVDKAIDKRESKVGRKRVIN